jgi:hypothetical protein
VTCSGGTISTLAMVRGTNSSRNPNDRSGAASTGASEIAVARFSSGEAAA